MRSRRFTTRAADDATQAKAAPIRGAQKRPRAHLHYSILIFVAHAPHGLRQRGGLLEAVDLQPNARWRKGRPEDLARAARRFHAVALPLVLG
eukprot:3920964-Pyramimonas_sp.AAC.1